MKKYPYIHKLSCAGKDVFCLNVSSFCFVYFNCIKREVDGLYLMSSDGSLITCLLYSSPNIQNILADYEKAK